MWSAVLLGMAFWLDGDLETRELSPFGGPSTVHAVRPSCGSATLGLMWPPQANDDKTLAQQLAREGLLEVCRWGPWKYNWASPTVHIRQLMQVARKQKD